LDLTGSVGGGGREWSSVNFIVSSSSEDGIDAQGIKTWLESSYVFSPPSSIPRTLLYGGVRYNIVVQLCNFIGGCSQANHQVTVLNSVKPMVTIPGPTIRTSSRTKPLLLSSKASLTVCHSDGTATTASTGISYAWEIKNGNDVIDIKSNSKDPSKFSRMHIPFRQVSCMM
jgi:hypothetical protein